MTEIQREEKLDTISCHNRITSENVNSNSELPHFNRSSMDGYAIKSNDSNGVSSSSPNYIKVIEEIKMGYPPNKKLKNGECSRIFKAGIEAGDLIIEIDNKSVQGMSLGEAVDLIKILILIQVKNKFGKKNC